MNDFFSETTLLNAPSIKRAAYSDRTAWLMSQLAGLVYEPLPCETSDKESIDTIYQSIERNDDRSHVEQLISIAIQDRINSQAGDIPGYLSAGRFELVEAFAVEGTEAMLVKHIETDNKNSMLVLVFRGTQPGITDVVTDLKANLVSAAGGGRVHNGFYNAFQKVEKQIQAALDQNPDIPLFITGHSLGGALAMLATRYLGNDSTGATYTFGAPRTADDQFYKGIKTPIYRIVNAADAVPRVPFGYGLSMLLSLIRLIPINSTKSISEFLRRHFVGYTHEGNLIFLSDAKNEPCQQNIPFKSLKVKKSPNIFWRCKTVITRWISTCGKAGATDHSMSEYSQKLAAHALRRNK